MVKLLGFGLTLMLKLKLKIFAGPFRRSANAAKDLLETPNAALERNLADIGTQMRGRLARRQAMPRREMVVVQLLL